MNEGRWDGLRQLIEEFGLRPILAVVPDNQDCELDASPPAPGFWEQMRRMQTAGATIALHGYRHLCSARGKSILPFGDRSEFAGVAAEMQRDQIARGAGILRGHGLDPRLWVAPKHTFDWNTLRALREEGFEYLSDGFARVPFRRGGVTWIPMQLWEPVQKARGLWTICMHPNTTVARRLDQLRAFLRHSAAQFTSFDRVVAEFDGAELRGYERLYEFMATERVRLRRRMRGWKGR
jgi:predicted deacetylase